MLCLSEVRVWILCVDGRSRYLYIVLGRYLRILGGISIGQSKIVVVKYY